MSKSRALAMCAGCLGATASATGKLGMDGRQVTRFCDAATAFLAAAMTAEDLTENEVYVTYVASVVIRIGFLVFTILLNAVMWGLFMEAMQGLNSGEAVVLNTGTNILVSAFLGKVIFGESFGTFWLVGASLILCGMVVLQSWSAPHAQKKKT